MQTNKSIREGSAKNRYILWNVAYITMIIMTIVSVAVVTPLIFAHTNLYRFLLAILVFIPLAWMIPMTLLVRRARNEVGTYKEKTHLPLAVFCTIFAGIIPGIFAIIATSMFVPKEVKEAQDLEATQDIWLDDFPTAN